MLTYLLLIHTQNNQDGAAIRGVRRDVSTASSSNQTISSMGEGTDGSGEQDAGQGQALGDDGPSLVDANSTTGQQGGANRAARRRANKKGKK